MELSFDIKRTKAILIGTAEYEDFQDIPPIINNLQDFKEVLTMKNIIGISEENIFVLSNVDNNKTLKEIKTIINNPDFIDFNTLIIYFTGHGYRKRWKKELYLASKNSDKDITTSFIHFNELKDTIENSHFQNRILIIDACHSGLAAQSVTDEKFDESEITIEAPEIKTDSKGTYVITSSSGSEKSLFDRDERNTFFTSELINSLKSGTPKKAEFIDLDNIFTDIQNKLIQKQLPKPQRKSTFNYPKFYFCQNTYYPFAQKREQRILRKQKDEYRELFDLFYDDYHISERERKMLFNKQKELKLDNAVIKQIENEIIKQQEKRKTKNLKGKIEQLQQTEWIECETKKTIDDFYRFIDKFKTGKFVDLAYIQINNLKEEEEKKKKEKERLKDWNNAKNSNTIQSYDFFLNKYKSGKYTYSANRSLSKLMREEQERESLRKKDWENAKTINSIKSYEDFINKHIKGKYIPTAIKNLNLLKTEEKSNLEFNNTQEEKNNSSTSMLYDILYFAWDIILIIFYAFVIYLIFLLIGGLFIDTFSDTTLHIIGIIIAFVYLIWKIIDEFFF